MVNSELVFVFSCFLFVTGLHLSRLFRMLNAAVVTAFISSFVLLAWLSIGSIIHYNNVDITYHNIQKDVLLNGTEMKYIIVKDNDGKARAVDLATAGINVPIDASKYQIVRKKYRQNTLGLRFSNSCNYDVVKSN